jgi:FtsZ-binding cell division protein ZapB
MKKLLLLLTLATNIQAQDGSFSGTVFDLDSGRVQAINGSIESPQPKDTLLQTMRRINAELKESNDRLSAEIAASHQLEELRRQTRLLQEIADK